MRTRFLDYILPALKISFAAATIYYLFVDGAFEVGPIPALPGERIGAAVEAAAVAVAALRPARPEIAAPPPQTHTSRT